jgi:hypothetical protein
MRLFPLQRALHDVFLDSSGTPRHRLTKKPLPRHVLPDGADVLLFWQDNVIEWSAYAPFFAYVVDSPEVLLDPSLPVPLPPHLRAAEMALQHHPMTPAIRVFYQRCRDTAMRRLFSTFMERPGRNPSRAQDEVAQRFGVDVRVVRTVLRKVKGTVTTELTAVRKQFKDDPRYAVLMKEISNTRSRLCMAGKAEGEGKGEGEGKAKFNICDILPHYNGSAERYIPQTCPVLGVQLNYTVHKSHHAPRIARKDVTKPYEPGNVLIVSALAYRMIQGLITPDAAARLLTQADRVSAGAGAAFTHWRAWEREHNTLWGIERPCVAARRRRGLELTPPPR